MKNNNKKILVAALSLATIISFPISSKASEEAQSQDTKPAYIEENQTQNMNGVTVEAETTPQAEEVTQGKETPDQKARLENLAEEKDVNPDLVEGEEEPTNIESNVDESEENQEGPVRLMAAADGEEISPTNAITNVNITIGGFHNEGANLIKPLGYDKNNAKEDNYLKAGFSFDIPKGAKEGDSFEVKLSDNVNLNGATIYNGVKDLEIGGKTIAKSIINKENNTITYTFTKDVNDLKDIKLSTSFPIFIDKNKVKENRNKETITINVSGQEASSDYKIDYEVADKGITDKNIETLSGYANIDEVTDDSYTHTIYVNTDNQKLTNSQIYVNNAPGTSGATFDEDVANSTKIYKLKEGRKLSPSFALNMEDLDLVSNATKSANNNQLDVHINQTMDNSSYVIVYRGKRDSNQSLKTRVSFDAKTKYVTNYKYNNYNGTWKWDN